jgi:hypothetical protein
MRGCGGCGRLVARRLWWPGCCHPCSRGASSPRPAALPSASTPSRHHRAPHHRPPTQIAKRLAPIRHAAIPVLPHSLTPFLPSQPTSPPSRWPSVAPRTICSVLLWQIVGAIHARQRRAAPGLLCAARARNSGPALTTAGRRRQIYILEVRTAVLADLAPQPPAVAGNNTSDAAANAVPPGWPAAVINYTELQGNNTNTTDAATANARRGRNALPNRPPAASSSCLSPSIITKPLSPPYTFAQ